MNKSNRLVATWLLSGCFLIFAMVVIGGITRLTGSGLSITEWKPIMGAVPPLNNADWEKAFQKYQQIPQFQKVNYHFDLGDFKSIFWWEYLHRLIGRLIGIVFIIPFLWFYFKRILNRETTKKVLLLFLLGGLQGFLGWFMVSSGLSERTSVSHIRLAIHLITAFITFGLTFYFALELIYKNSKPGPSGKLHSFVSFLLLIITVQIIYGAFVAGLHAGKIYNTFPLMNGRFIPPGMSYLEPSWINFFDNPVTVQFIHRFFAGLISVLSVVLIFRVKKLSQPESLKKGMTFYISMLVLQLVLGIVTLLTNVNIPLAVIHQAGAFMLFSGCIYLMFLLKPEN